jgi:hypothetical protein
MELVVKVEKAFTPVSVSAKLRRIGLLEEYIMKCLFLLTEIFPSRVVARREQQIQSPNCFFDYFTWDDRLAGLLLAYLTPSEQRM